tara:strand:+ start:3433 stop:5229 length:1797 start_codon:yes stop_codon:yes gene_type:complete
MQMRPTLGLLASTILAAHTLVTPSPAVSTTAVPSTSTRVAELQDDLPDLKDVTDGAIRWLRGTQDRVDGSYAGGVEGTAWVLRALAESPRHYTPEDGVFVKDAVAFLVGKQNDTGAIVDADAPQDRGRIQTHLAALALFHYTDGSTKDVYAKALHHLSADAAAMPRDPAVTFASVEEAVPYARRLLAGRGENGRWDSKEGAVIATAQAVVELSRCYDLIEAAKLKTARTPVALPTWSAEDAKKTDASILTGARFLIAAAEDGKWGAPGQPDAGMTAMVLSAIQTVPQPRPADVQLVIDSGLAWLLTMQHENGAIHQGRLANYTTSAAILALSEAQDPAFQGAIIKARNFLIGLQADEGEGYSEGDRYYGGIGYGGDERPDLSNLQMALEALAASGLESDHEAYQRAVKFLERCQNRSESNDVQIVDGDVIVKSGDDGGAGYMPGDSKAGFDVRTENGKTIRVPRSYGSMTYAMLKSFVFAGLNKDDERVQACWTWLQRNYTLDVNPGFETSKDPTAPYQGLFYYFHSMARALDVFGADTVTDGAGVEHAWRVELAARLVAMQSRIDGSWVNANAPRWWEGNPVLATSYALLTLDACRK